MKRCSKSSSFFKCRAKHLQAGTRTACGAMSFWISGHPVLKSFPASSGSSSISSTSFAMLGSAAMAWLKGSPAWRLNLRFNRSERNGQWASTCLKIVQQFVCTGIYRKILPRKQVSDLSMERFWDFEPPSPIIDQSSNFPSRDFLPSAFSSQLMLSCRICLLVRLGFLGVALKPHGSSKPCMHARPSSFRDPRMTMSVQYITPRPYFDSLRSISKDTFLKLCHEVKCYGNLIQGAA